MKWGEFRAGDVILCTAYGAPMLVLESKPDAEPLMYLRLLNLETGQLESHGALAEFNSSWFMFQKAGK